MSAYKKLLSRIPGTSYRGRLGNDELHELQRALDGSGVRVLVLQGARMKTVDALFKEFSRTFEFPDYFGSNWDALDECICDLDWLPSQGYCVVIEDAGDLLRDELPTELETLLRVLTRASSEWGTSVEQGEPWDRPAKAFSIIFNLPSMSQEVLLALPLITASARKGLGSS